MQSRSSALKQFPAPRLSPIALSGALHGALGALVLVLLFYKPPVRQKVEISVIDAPKKAPEALSLSRTPPKEKPKIKPRAVFGLSRKAMTTEAPEAADIKTGNTVAKAPDNEKLKPEDADSLPVPTEEYLVTRMPELADEVRVPYPADARSRGVQGAVVMDLLIDAEGKVREARFVEGPDGSLNDAALVAVRGFRFKPALVQDRPVAVRIRYAYRFILEH